MTREEAYARCSSDSYVEFYGGQWLIVPFAPVEQPNFFVCSPVSVRIPNRDLESKQPLKSANRKDWP